MLNQLANVQVWVNDQEEALAFYTEKLGVEVREDVTVPELGNFRWLSVGVPGQDVAIVLMAVPGAPVFDDETRQQILDLLAKGAAGGRAFTTGDCRPSHEERAARRRVHPGADRAALRRRRRLPRSVREPVPDGGAELSRHQLVTWEGRR